MTRAQRLFKYLIHRLSGAPARTAADAGEVFRSFADGVERRLGGDEGRGPKIRVPASDGAFRVWR